MATGRTISASFLTAKDNKIISLCESISTFIAQKIPKKMRKDFIKNFGKISYSRDGGLGVGSGKLQRDAICTRGRQGKAPFSNRNLRWHPLVIAEKNYGYAKEIDYFKKGIVEFDSQSKEDFCIDANKLNEFFCEDRKIKEEIFTCQEGCSNGICKK